MFEEKLSEKGIKREDLEATMCRKLEFNFKLLTFIKSLENGQGISCVTKKDIAEEMGCSPSLVYKTIRLLSTDGGLIEKIDNGKYKVHQTDIFKYGPFANYIKFIYTANLNPDFMNCNWKDQAKMSGISYNQLQRVYAWINIGMRESRHMNTTNDFDTTVQ